MLLKIERRGRGHLRRRRRRASAGHVDNPGASELGPTDVRRVGRHRRGHLARRSPVALHRAEPETVVRPAIGHDSARGNHAPEARGIHDRVRGETEDAGGVVVARRGHEDDAGFVGHVDRVGPRGRRNAAHTERQHVHARRLVAAQLDSVVDALGDVARAQLDHRLPDPDRNDLSVWSAAQDVVEAVAAAGKLKPLAGKDAEGAGAVAGVVERAVRTWIMRVVGRLIVDEIALQVEPHSSRQRRVVGIVSGVEMGNPDARRGACRGARALEFRLIEMPRKAAVDVRKIATLIVEDACSRRQSAAAAPGGILVGPLLNEVRLDEKRSALGRKFRLRIQGMRHVPRVRGVGCRDRPGQVPFPGRSAVAGEGGPFPCRSGSRLHGK